MKKLNFLFAILFLVACTTQQYAGIGKKDIIFGEKGNVKEIHIINGKEAGDILLVVETKDGSKITISGKEMEAFEGQRTRAEAVEILIQSIEEGIK